MRPAPCAPQRHRLDRSRGRYEPESARQREVCIVGDESHPPGGRMALWRIRIRLSDDPHSRAQLDLALAGQRVKDVTFAPRDADSAEMAGDVVLELPQDEDPGTLLGAPPPTPPAARRCA